MLIREDELDVTTPPERAISREACYGGDIVRLLPKPIAIEMLDRMAALGLRGAGTAQRNARIQRFILSKVPQQIHQPTEVRKWAPPGVRPFPTARRTTL